MNTSILLVNEDTSISSFFISCLRNTNLYTAENSETAFRLLEEHNDLALLFLGRLNPDSEVLNFHNSIVKSEHSELPFFIVDPGCWTRWEGMLIESDDYFLYPEDQERLSRKIESYVHSGKCGRDK